MSDTPTKESFPNLDWSQVGETVHMLQLALAQIEMAMREGDESVNTLGELFTSMVGSVSDIAQSVEAMDDSGETDAVKSLVRENCDSITAKMKTAIVAFQFYDKLSQRLNHVNTSLDKMADLVGDRARVYSPWEWKELQEQIRSKYCLPQEVEMFEAVLSGVSVQEALAHCEAEMKAAGVRFGDIELF
jgi:uncharacterized protein YoxC